MIRRSSVPALGSVLGLAALFVSLPAEASPLIELTGSVGDNGGAQGVVAGPGVASTYWNPAALTFADDEVLFGFALVSEQIGITLDGRRGGDVPLTVGGRGILQPNGQPLPNDVVPTQWLQNGCPAGTTAGTCPAPGFAARPRQSQGTSGATREYVTLGFVKHLMKDRIAVGAYAMLPVSNFTTAQSFYSDEREALFSNSLHPELYGDRLTSISVVFGAGVKVLPNLAVGAGLSLGLTNTAQSATYVSDSTNYNSLLLNNSVKTTASVTPSGAFYYQPLPWLHVGGTVHTPQAFRIDTTVTATLPSGTESGTSMPEVFDWMPWSFQAGVLADVVHRGLYTMSVVASLDYALWSAYEDRHGQSPSMYGSELGWSNTLSGAIGVRHVYGPARGFVDLTYAPSPVPEQIGNSNYVDNDRFGISAGGDVEIRLWSVHVRPGLQLMADRLIYRHNTKDDSLITDQLPDGSVYAGTHDPVPGAAGLQTNNPGWPGFASAGWVWGGAFTLSVPL